MSIYPRAAPGARLGTIPRPGGAEVLTSHAWALVCAQALEDELVERAEPVRALYPRVAWREPRR